MCVWLRVSRRFATESPVALPAGKLSFPALDAKIGERAAESRVAGGDERSEHALDAAERSRNGWNDIAAIFSRFSGSRLLAGKAKKRELGPPQPECYARACCSAACRQSFAIAYRLNRPSLSSHTSNHSESIVH